MRDYGAVSPKFWTGGTGKSLRGDMEGQLVALYLMTSPHANMIGVYYCPIDYIAKETGLTVEGASKALERLSEKDFCTYDADEEWVFVHQFAAHQIGEALKADDKRVKGVANELSKLPNGRCAKAFRQRYAAPYFLDKSPIEAPSKEQQKPHRSQKQEQEQKQEQDSCAKPPGSAQPSGFAIPLNDGTDWPVPSALIAEWRGAFPAVDVEQELREMRVWSLAKPDRRKTSRGVNAFVVHWLQKAQDTPSRHRPAGESRQARDRVGGRRPRAWVVRRWSGTGRGRRERDYPHAGLAAAGGLLGDAVLDLGAEGARVGRARLPRSHGREAVRRSVWADGDCAYRRSNRRANRGYPRLLGAAMHGMIIPDDIDFSAWERETDAKRNVRSASEWVAELIERLRNPDQAPKVFLPWDKAREVFHFRPGEVTIWAGQNGHGKTGLVGQIKLSLMGQGHRVCGASFEMKPRTELEILIRMYCGMNPYSPEFQNEGGRDALEHLYREFGDWADGRLWMYDQQGTADPRNVLGMARYSAKELGCSHIFIDNLAKCVKGEDDFNGQKVFVDELTALARDNGVHVHLVHHTRKPANENHIPDKHDNKGSGSITDQADNVMIVWRNKAKEDEVKAGKKASPKLAEPDAYLLCRKQRNGDDEPTIGLWFDKDSKQFKGDPADPVMFFPNWPHRPTRT
jgi:twinkle protein